MQKVWTSACTALFFLYFRFFKKGFSWIIMVTLHSAYVLASLALPEVLVHLAVRRAELCHLPHLTSSIGFESICKVQEIQEENLTWYGKYNYARITIYYRITIYNPQFSNKYSPFVAIFRLLKKGIVEKQDSSGACGRRLFHLLLYR